MSTARSSAARMSQIHKVEGESSNLVARSVEDASNANKEHPGLASTENFPSTNRPSGETI